MFEYGATVMDSDISVLWDEGGFEWAGCEFEDKLGIGLELFEFWGVFHAE